MTEVGVTVDVAQFDVALAESAVDGVALVGDFLDVDRGPDVGGVASYSGVGFVTGCSEYK